MCVGLLLISVAAITLCVHGVSVKSAAFAEDAAAALFKPQTLGTAEELEDEAVGTASVSMRSLKVATDPDLPSTTVPFDYTLNPATPDIGLSEPPLVRNVTGIMPDQVSGP